MMRTFPTAAYRHLLSYMNVFSYAPVLRPLRAIAQHIQFRKIPMLTIGKRLQEICDEEDLETDLRTLCLLAESTDGDIRSCLHTLQVCVARLKCNTKFDVVTLPFDIF